MKTYRMLDWPAFSAYLATAAWCALRAARRAWAASSSPSISGWAGSAVCERTGSRTSTHSAVRGTQRADSKRWGARSAGSCAPLGGAPCSSSGSVSSCGAYGSLGSWRGKSSSATQGRLFKGRRQPMGESPGTRYSRSSRNHQRPVSQRGRWSGGVLAMNSGCLASCEVAVSGSR